MIGYIIGFSVLGLTVIVLVVILLTRNKEKNSTYIKGGIQKKKLFEFSFIGYRDYNEVYNSQTITIYEDCIMVSKDNGSFSSYERIKLYDLDQCVFEIFSGIRAGDPPALCISLFSYALVEQSFKTVNDTKWKLGSTNKIFILFRFDESEKVVYEHELKAINEAISEAINKIKESDDYINEQKTYEEINDSVFMKQFISIYGCDLDTFKRRLVYISGHNKLLNEYAVSQMAMVYDKTNQKFALCEFAERANDLKSGIANLSVEEKLLFLTKGEIDSVEDYLSLIKQASIEKFRKLFLPANDISNISFEKATMYTSKRQNIGFHLAMQSEYIHQDDKDYGSDVSRYMISFSNSDFEKMYIDKNYFNETFSNKYSFLKQFLKEKASN